MNYLYSLSAIAGLLYVAYVMIRRARVDAVVAELRRKDRTQEIKEIARLEQEIKDAKISYNNSRREYDIITGELRSEKLSDESEQD